MLVRRVQFPSLYRPVVTSLLLVTFALLSAQNILNPKWVANGAGSPSEHPKFSADGSRVVVWGIASSSSTSASNWSVFNVADGKVLATGDLDGSNGTMSGAVLSPDGKTLYYGTTSGIFAYSVDTHTQVALPVTGASASNGAMYLDISKDGNLLAYVLVDPITKDNLIYTYSLTSHTVLHQIDIKNAATSNHTVALKLIANDTQVVVSGPTIYSVNGGAPLATGTEGNTDLAVSPDGTMIFTTLSSKVSAYSATDLHLIWGPVSVPGLYDAGSVTQDGGAILFTTTATKQWIVKGLSTASGSALPNLTISRPSVDYSPYITSIPGSSQILVGPEQSGGGGGFGSYYSEPGAEVWTYNSSNGTGAFVAKFCEGNVVNTDLTLVGISGTVSGQPVQQVVDTELHYSGNSVVVRSASNGAIQSTLPNGAVVSPNGKWYAQISGNGLGIYNVADATRVTSTTFTGVTLSTVRWGGNGMIAVTGTQGFGSAAGPLCVPFDGSNLSSTYTTLNFGNDAYRISPDGTKIADLSYYYYFSSGSVDIWDTVAGTKITTINPASSSSSIDDVTFSGNNLLGVHDLYSTNTSTYAQTVQYRVFDVSTATPVLVRSLIYQAPATVTNSGGGLSPDGQVIALGHYTSSLVSDPRKQSSVRLYSVASGALLNQWDNQFAANLSGSSSYAPFGFTPDSSAIFWVDGSALVAAPVVPFQMSLALNPTAVFGGITSTATVTVNPAQKSDVTFALSASSASASVPASITVPAGSTSATFSVTTQQLSSTVAVLISATYNGANASSTLTINPYSVASLSLAPTTVPGGTSSTGTVKLVQTTGSLGANVTLGVNSTDAQVPNTVFVPGGSNQATFSVTTNGVANDKTVKVTAGIGSSQQTASLTITAPVLSSVTVSPTSVVGGSISTGTVTLIGNAPTGGVVIGLTSSNTSVATVPLSVTIPAGTNTATFPINTSGVLTNATVTITATDVGNTSTTTKTATLTVQVPPLLSVTVSPTTVTGGSQAAVTGTVTLGGIAASAGDVIKLASSNATLVTVPASVTVAAGATTATFTLTTGAVTTAQAITITATFNGTNTTTTLNLTPFTVTGVALNPTTVVGGGSSTGTVTISQPPANGAVTVSLNSGSKDAQVPATVTIAVGSTTTTFTVTTNVVSNNEVVNIGASIGASQQSAKLTINAATLTSLTVSPATVAGGSSATGTATISQAAPTGGVSVALASDSAGATVPAAVVVPSGSTTATFTITTTGVKSQTTANITGTLGTGSKSAPLTINPATIQSLAVAPTSVVGGSQSTATGTVTMSGVAAPAGDVITLTSSAPSIASVPASVTVTGSQGTATFTVATQSVTSSTSVTITATFNGGTKTTSLTVNPFQISSLTITPASLIGGNAASGTVVISQAAGSAGAIVSLSSGTADAKVPSSVTVPGGASSATFAITTNAVAADESASISAAAGTGTGSKSASLLIQAPKLATFAVSPTSVIGGNTSSGSVSLTGIAPTGGLTVTLTSSSKAAVVPATVQIQGGASSATFSILTTGVSTSTTATIQAKLGAGTPLTASLTVQPPSLASVSLSDSSVIGGSKATITGTVTLSGFAPTGGLKVTLASSNKVAATVLATVTVPAGASSTTFVVTHLLVKASSTTSISGTLNGASQSATLTVNPFQVLGLTLSPTSIYSGASATGTVTLNAAPGTKSGAIVVKLTSSSKSATLPASVSVAVGSTTGTFAVKAGTVTASTPATITGTYLSSSQQASLTILPLPLLTSITVSPSSVVGSSSTPVVGSLTISGPAPAAGFVVKLTSSNTAAATVPASVTIPAGATSVTFAVAHKKVTASKSVNISGTLNGHSGSTTLTVLPG